MFFKYEPEVIFDAYPSYGLKDAGRWFQAAKTTSVKVEIVLNKTFSGGKGKCSE